MKTRTVVSFVLSLFTATAFAAAPQVGNVSLSANSSKATITYDLSVSAGIVTMEIQTNTVADLSGEWVPLDGLLLTNTSGDVSCVVQPGTGRKIDWPTKDVFGGTKIRNARAVLTAWPTNAPPDWCIGDLTGADVPRYYTATNYFPLGFGNNAYKTSKVVFKRVSAKGKTFSMGQPTAILSNANGTRPVTLARDYYLAIYETTQAQYHYATGKESPKNTTQWPTGEMFYDSKLPYLISTGWTNVRGKNLRDDGYTVASDSFLGAARTKTGLLVDLPTEAEWEFAARCGGMRTKSQLVNGEDAAITDVAWVSSNSGNACHDVGLKLPNDWGFYDMLGNVAEWCVDLVENANTTPLSASERFDPIGTDGGLYYVNRGGRYATSGSSVTERLSTGGWGNPGYGFRMVAIIEPYDFSTEPDVDGVKMFQNPVTRKVKIGYNLTDADKIVTLVIETNTMANASGDWVALPEQATSSAFGDVNRIVKHGASSKWIYWNPDDSFADELVASGAARAVLTTWATNTPPNYMVVDLTGSSIVRYYTSTNALPDGGLANPIYKSRYMVFRKIPAKDIIWRKGVDPDGDTVSGWTADNLARVTPYRVKLTYDYYIAIYELTRAQLGTIYGAKVGSGALKDGYTYTDVLPAGGCYYNALATATTNNLNNAEWYGGQYVFKIQSDAEWEFACRAGEPKVLYSGENFSRSALYAIANADYHSELAVGGSKPCNRWGLYDMLGNVGEMCRDQMTASSPEWTYWKDDAGYNANGYIVDPEGPGVASNRVVERGFYAYLNQQYLASQGDGYAQIVTSQQNNFHGTRLVCPIPNE